MTPVGFFASPGMLLVAFSFISSLIGTDPSPADFHGCGGLSGGDFPGDGTVAKSGPSIVESIVKTANAGEFLVTFAEPPGNAYLDVLYQDASVASPPNGPGDEYDGRVSELKNLAAGRTTKVTLLVTIVDDAGAPAELNARVVSVFLVLKISRAGA